jgi:cobalamin biosynthesis protein CobT
MDVKQKIVDLFSAFSEMDLDADYYKDSEKNEIVDKFKALLFTDDQEVRQFLKQWFSASLDFAKQLGLANDEGSEYTAPEGNEEQPTEEPGKEGGEENTEEQPAEEPEEDETSKKGNKKNESVEIKQPTLTERYIKRANDFLM